MSKVELESIPVTFRREIAGNEFTGVDVLEILLTDDDPFVRRNAALNNVLPADKLFSLLNDEVAFVRKAAKVRLELNGFLCNPQINPPVRVKRIGSLDVEKFKDLFLNPEIPISEISALAGVTEGSLRTYASKLKLKNPRKRNK